MPRLDEYRGKKILNQFKIPIPKGELALNPKQASKIAKNLSGSVVIKALIEISGRFKAGAIKFAQDPTTAQNQARDLLNKEIKGIKIKRLLVEERLNIEKEFYLGFGVSDSVKIKGPLLMFSPRGGIEVENFPEKIIKLKVNFLKGVPQKTFKKELEKLEFPNCLIKDLIQVATNLYQVFRKYSCKVAEINPLVLTSEKKLVAADCRLEIDEASVFKYPQLQIDYPRDIGRMPTKLEKVAWKIEEKDFRGTGYFIQLAQDFKAGEGVVGFHGIGGGGAMMGAEALIDCGLKLANYADTSGNPPASKIYRIVKLILSQPNIDGYILMGPVMANQEQWHHAHALIKALREELKTKPNFPVIILLAGNKEQESLQILKEHLKKLPARIEIYDRNYVYRLEFLAQRMKELVKKYRRN